MVKNGFPARQSTSPSKMGWRSNIITTWRETSGLRKLNPGDSLVTLGGSCSDGSAKPKCEYDQIVLQEGLCSPIQYVLIDRDESVHEKNSTIIGRTWILGHFGESFATWYYLTDHHAALVSADMMSGIDIVIESVAIILSTIKDNQKRGRFSLVVFNIIERMPSTLSRVWLGR